MNTQDHEANPVVYTFADGHKVVHLVTEEAKQYEKDVLQHWLGTDEQIGQADLVLSLRTPEGKPIITFIAESLKEEGRYLFTQVLPEKNRFPTEEENKRLIEFMENKYPNNVEGLLLVGKPSKDLVFKGANLSGSFLVNENLSKATFERSNFTDAIFSGANLEGASLVGTDFSKACLFHVNLKGADLSETNLEDVDLGASDLSGANLSGAKFTNIRYSSQTVWPEGFTPPPSR